MIFHNTALKYADKECDVCHGEGVVIDSQANDAYCFCVKENMAEEKGEMLMENDNDN